MPFSHLGVINYAQRDFSTAAVRGAARTVSAETSESASRGVVCAHQHLMKEGVVR